MEYMQSNKWSFFSLILVAMVVCFLFATSGCTTDPAYTAYLKASESANGVESERIKGLSAAAATGNQGAVMALALSGQGKSGSNILPPQSTSNALGWGSLLLQAFGIHTNRLIQVHGQDANVIMDAGRNAMIGNLAGSGGSNTTTTINTGDTSSVTTGSGTSNSGRISSDDATSTPTVVMQPAPVIVPPADPVIVNPVIVHNFPCAASAIC